MTTNPRIKDMAAQDRPRERLVLAGADALSNAELIAILLRTGLKGYSAIHIAQQLLAKFGTLDGLARAPLEELRQVKGVGRDKAVTLKAAFTLARKMAAEMRAESPLLDTPERIADLLREESRPQDVEQFRVVLLNTRRRLIGLETISQGTLDTLLVHPREVFKRAIAANASAVVLVHNHPSGDPTPSADDRAVTRQLVDAGRLLDVPVYDHVVIGGGGGEGGRYVSFAEAGLL